MNELIIDVHAHYLPRLVFERFDQHAKEFSSVQMIRDNTSTRLAFAGGEPTRPIAPKLSDLQDRKQWMDKNGIDHQLVGGWLDSFGYELPAAEGAAWSRYLNHCLLDALDDEPRFTPLATVPLQDGALAAEVLKEAWQQGFGGVMIGTLPKGSSGVLDAPELDLFWAQADALGVAVFLHPMFLCGEPRLSDYDLVNALGRIADTSIAVSRLLYSGHLLRYPNLKLVLSHGGAALPFVLGRLSRNFTIAQGKYADPRKGFATLYFDSVVFDQAALRLLVEVAGDGRVMLGSDMPFPIGDPHPRAVIEHGSCFSEPQRKAMLGQTSSQVFRLRTNREKQ
jgi:aminocarboxymuconate-semialdehyde decarboxylase